MERGLGTKTTNDSTEKVKGSKREKEPDSMMWYTETTSTRERSADPSLMDMIILKDVNDQWCILSGEQMEV